MKILLIHNEYARYSGEEAAFYSLCDALRRKGQTVRTFVRSSADIPHSWAHRSQAFFTGIWSRAVAAELAKELDDFQPDVVHIQNLYPLISSSIVPVVARSSAALVMGCHNYRLFCPTGLMLRNGMPCSQCATAGEYRCVAHNCMGSVGRSLGYALRNRVARPLLLKHVDQFNVLSSFQATRFTEWGVPKERLAVVPNFVSLPESGNSSVPAGSGTYVGFLGRVSPEKGIGVLLDAARMCPDIPFRIAGHMIAMPAADQGVPGNVRFIGELTPSEVPGFLAGARFSVAPSIWYEAFGLVAVEAMLAARPVIASEIVAFADIVEHNRTGVLVRPGDAAQFAAEIKRLWAAPQLCTDLGEAAKEQATVRYAEPTVYGQVLTSYEAACKRKGLQPPSR